MGTKTERNDGHGHEYTGDGEKGTGAPGSHEESHKKVGGARTAIHQGTPAELEKFHHSKTGQVDER